MSVCPYCQANGRAYLSAPDFNRGVSKTVFHLDRCDGCGLLYVTNPPDDLARYYTTDYHFVPRTAEELESHLPAQRFKLDLVTPYRSGGRLLEIGPGIGTFARVAQKAGFDVSTIEIDPDCVAFMREALGIRAVQSADPAEVLRREDRTYDAICLWHSIEHMARPWDVLTEAANRLAPDGILLIAAPNPLSWQARVLGRRWVHHDLPRHLFGLSIPWVLGFAEKAGLRPELVTTRDEGSLYWNHFTWAMLASRLSPHPRLTPRIWNLGIRFGRAIEFWEGREGQGATYTVVLRRAG